MGDSGGRRWTKKLTLTKSANLPDIVPGTRARPALRAWRTWKKGAPSYLCIEPGICESAEAVVGAGETWMGWQEISVEAV